MEASTLQDLLFVNKALQSHASQSQQLQPGQQLLHNPVADQYLTQLLRQPLSALTAEPASLSQQSSQVDSELSSLCFRSFPLLLQSYASTKSLSQAFNHLEEELGAFVSTSASLTSACRTFDANTRDNMAQRSKISQVLPSIDNVGDILDIPRLVGTCVSAGYWNEALDLAQRAEDLEALCSSEQHTRAQARMQEVVRQVEAEMATLKIRVLEQMREKSLKLPGAVRAMALLRRLSPALNSGSNNSKIQSDEKTQSSQTEARFQLILLASRWDCLRFQLDALHASSDLSTDDDRLKFLRRVVEVWREVIADAAGMFTELFLAQNDPMMGPAAKAPLNGFLHLALDRLLQLLRQHVPHLHTGSNLATLLTQLTYCSNAFATRFGFDFKPTVDATVRSRMLDLVKERWAAGLASLKQQLVGKTQPLPQLVVAPESLAKVLSLPEPADNGSSNSFSHQPPGQLALFPPLARFLNAIATALNELRLIPSAAATLYPVLHEELVCTLDEAGKIVLAVVEASLPQPSTNSDSGSQDAEEQEQRQQKRQLARILCVWSGRVCIAWCARALAEAAKDAGAQDVPQTHEIPNHERFESMIRALPKQTA